MSYQLIKDLTKVNRTVRSSRNIKYIVIHYTGNSTDTAKANANYFRSTNRGASAHYFVDKSTVYQVVEDKDEAWAVGRNYGSGNLFKTVTNANSISIEMCSNNGAIANETFNNTVQLTKVLMNKYKISASNVYRHWDVCSKNCPGWNGWGAAGKNSDIWNKFKSLIGSPSISVTPTIRPSTSTNNTSSNIDVFYRAYAGNKWYPEVKNTTDYAGVENKAISALAIRASRGVVKYRVHVKSKNKWLPFVTMSNINDNNNGYAGILKSDIDGLQAEINGVPGYNILYRVSVVGSKSFLPWVTNWNNTNNGYAGIFGKSIDKVEIKVVKK